jgi:hypothetical protein
MRILALAVVLAMTSQSMFSQSEARLLRFPTISKDAIVFTYAGDLYTVPRCRQRLGP